MEEVTRLKGKYFLFGLGIGVATTYILKENIKKHPISSEKALDIVKKAFKQKGPIDGSWIYTIPEKYETAHLTFDVYKAGISRTVDNLCEQYEAYVDTKTGAIIHVEQIA